MIDPENIWIPALVAIGLTVVTVVSSIHIKFSNTKEEAFSSLKVLLMKIWNYIIFALLAYFLHGEVTSDAELTRQSVFMIVLLSCLIVVLILLSLIEPIRGLTGRILGLNRKQTDLLEKIIKKGQTDE